MSVARLCTVRAWLTGLIVFVSAPLFGASASGQDMKGVAHEILHYAKACLKEDTGHPLNSRLTVLNAGADPQLSERQMAPARKMHFNLDAELSSLPELIIKSPATAGRALDVMWDVWRNEALLKSHPGTLVQVDVVLLSEIAPVGGNDYILRFIIHNPRTACTKFTQPLPLVGMREEPARQPAEARDGEAARIEEFIRRVSFGDGIADFKPPASSFGDPIDLFDWGPKSRAEAVALLDQYNRTFSHRMFRVVDGTMRVTPIGGNLHSVTFEFEFELIRAGVVTKGRESAWRVVRGSEGRYAVVTARSFRLKDQPPK